MNYSRKEKPIARLGWVVRSDGSFIPLKPDDIPPPPPPPKDGSVFRYYKVGE